ncbi:MAG: multicopper oxidase family protein [Caldilineaceae bacterium]
MKQRTLSFILLLLPALVMQLTMPSFVGAAWAAPGSAPAAAALPGTTCTSTGAATRTCDLWATTGALVLPDSSSVPIWGFADSAGGAATLPGPALIVNQGETVTVNLTNNLLTQAVAIRFLGQLMPTDLTGAAANGGTTSYTFTASEPGTFLYEAGLLNSQQQVAMGLFGALIVRPATAGQAYADVNSAYDDEALVILSEIDPNLNNSADPSTFDMRTFTPRYWLINGQAHPNTAEITTNAGNRVLLRYISAGLQYHSMSLLGAHQTVLAVDGLLQSHPHNMVAETIAPGQTVDVITTIPANAASGARFALYDAAMTLRNSGTATAFGGMLTFLTVGTGGGGGDTAGPNTSDVALTASGGDIIVDATVDDTATGGSNIAAAEFYIDSTANAPTAMTGAFAAPSEAVQGTITAATLAGLSSGDHTIYVRGQDAAGNWGAFATAVLAGLDTAGPTSSALLLNPNPTNGGMDVMLTATGDDSASGNGNIAAAEYFIDTTGADGSGTAMNVNLNQPIASLDATILAATVFGLGEGLHPAFVHSQDAAGNWGAFAQVDLLVDQTGPNTTGVTVEPNPNNGALSLNPGQSTFRVTAQIAEAGPTAAALELSDLNKPIFMPMVMGAVNPKTDDGVSAAAINETSGQPRIVAAEGFIGAPGADGTGFPFTASDGVFDSTNETVFADVSLNNIASLVPGSYTINVHGKDVAGNWGPFGAATLVIEKDLPTISNAAVSPSPTNGATSVALTAAASDASSAIALGEWFVGADPGEGNGAPMSATFNGTDYDLSASIDVSGWAAGNYTLVVRARDEAGNWSGAISTSLDVNTAPVNSFYFSTRQGGNTNGPVPGVGGPYDDADIYHWDGNAFSRTVDATAITNRMPGNANVDGLVFVSPAQFYVSFARSGGTSVPGVGTVQDEDIVFYNGGNWSMFFDGSAYGMDASSGQNIDAFDIDFTDGSIYFSTAGGGSAAAIQGVAGPNDDADIYRFDGAVFERVFDGSNEGLPGNADINGLVWLGGDNYLISFDRDGGVNVPGLGVVQDEDIVEFNAGAWTSFFDGSTEGVSSTVDLDALSAP